MEQIPQETVNAAPVKSFFVSMLTRDIKLEEAILDLLDNCVDGILRNHKDVKSDRPYEGSWAKITFEKDSFSIEDNCGGIPWDLSAYAFRMGRDPAREPDSEGVVGVYGIGMKRAIFKMGRSCSISTRSGDDEYEVEITPEWIEDQEDWNIPVTRKPTAMDQDGTMILIGNLHEGIAARFHEEIKSFTAELERLIASHYAFIIAKGFSVTVNGEPVHPRSRELIFAEDSDSSNTAIRPFMYKTKTSRGVDVFLAVGFTRPIPSQDEVINDQDEKRYSTEDAGWTILCNDRAVLYCDRSELTGWGEAGVPRYHTQFIAVSGIVEFRSNDPSELPTTTTKRGIDASSIVYLQVKNKMREGMKLFTDYTNRWKGQTEDTRAQFEAGKPLSFVELKSLAETMRFRAVPQSTDGATQYRPELPRPQSDQPSRRRIAFSKHPDEIEKVAQYLFNNSRTAASAVGEKCFDIMLEEATS